MKAISLWQPYASAMARRLKSVETRSWHTKYRGDLLICSAKVKPKPGDFQSVDEFFKALTLPFGCALCIVEVYDCIPTEHVVHSLGNLQFDREKPWGDYTPGRFGWMTRHLRPLKKPVPVKGKQGLWIPSADEMAAIKEQLP